jgi:hypothetical protein
MNETFIKGILYAFACSAGVGFVLLIGYLFKSNQKKDAQIAVKETEIEYKKLQGEIDDSSLLNAVRRNNERKGRDS